MVLNNINQMKTQKQKCVVGSMLTGATVFAISPIIHKARAVSIDPERPNIILIMADDLGWTDINCRNDDLSPTPGGEFDSTYYQTPHLKELRKNSLRFTNACVYPFCSATRAGLLTGKYPSKLKMTNMVGKSLYGYLTDNNPGTIHDNHSNNCQNMLPGFGFSSLPLKEITVAEVLKQHGYNTCMIGKWHLSSEIALPDEYYYSAENQGFDIRLGSPSNSGYSNNMSHNDNLASPGENWVYRQYAYLENELGYKLNVDERAKTGYLTDFITKRALEYIDMQTTIDTTNSFIDTDPFFLYLPHHAVHTTISSRKDITKKFQDKSDPRGLHETREYAGMIYSFDKSIGFIFKQLEQKNIIENTVIIVLSDNGGMEGSSKSESGILINNITENYPLYKGKAVYEVGSVRVPMMVYWNGKTNTEPNMVCDKPFSVIDIMPTICKMAGVYELPNDIDGISFYDSTTGAIATNTVRENRTRIKQGDNAIFWNCPNPHTNIGFPFYGKSDESNSAKGYSCPSAFVQQDGFWLFKRYSAPKYNWPNDFDIKKMRLKYEPESTPPEYELFKVDPNFKWVKEGYDKVLNFNGGSEVLVTGYTGEPGSSTKSCSFSIKPQSKEGTILAWEYASCLDNKQKTFLDKERYILLRIYLDNSELIIQNGEKENPVSTGIKLNKDIWCNINLDFSYNNGALYIHSDNKTLGTITVLPYTPNILHIGGCNGKDYFNGIIKDVAITESGKKIAHWPINEGKGLIIYNIENDRQTTNNHGVIVGDISQMTNLYTTDPNSEYYKISQNMKDILLDWQIDVDAEMIHPVAYIKDVNSNITGDSFGSIQEAINYASTGQTIVICPGTHLENLIINKQITLQSINPYDLLTVENTIINSSAITINNQSSLVGLTISSSENVINGNGNSGLIENCIIRDGLGIGINNFDGTIKNCLVVKNTSTGLHGCDGLIINCTIADNGGYGLNGYTSAIISNCIIWGNKQGTLQPTPTPKYCCINNWLDDELENKSLNPLFINPDHYNYNLSNMSPYINLDHNITQRGFYFSSEKHSCP